MVEQSDLEFLEAARQALVDHGHCKDHYHLNGAICMAAAASVAAGTLSDDDLVESQKVGVFRPGTLLIESSARLGRLLLGYEDEDSDASVEWSLCAFNNTHSLDEILALFDEKIAVLKQEPQLV